MLLCFKERGEKEREREREKERERERWNLCVCEKERVRATHTRTRTHTHIDGQTRTIRFILGRVHTHSGHQKLKESTVNFRVPKQSFSIFQQNERDCSPSGWSMRKPDWS